MRVWDQNASGKEAQALDYSSTPTHKDKEEEYVATEQEVCECVSRKIDNNVFVVRK